jgi:ketosteroid isomerase-like protein
MVLKFIIMKKAILNAALFGSLTTAILSCNNKKEESADVMIDKAQIKKEIQAKENEFAETYNGGVLKNIGYYADEATTFFQNRPPLVGKEAIVEYLASDVKSNSNKISFQTNEVFVSKDGVQVVEVGYYKVVDTTGNPVNTGNYMSLFEKRDGKYVCVRDMSASDMMVE